MSNVANENICCEEKVLREIQLMLTQNNTILEKKFEEIVRNQILNIFKNKQSINIDSNLLNIRNSIMYRDVGTMCRIKK